MADKNLKFVIQGVDKVSPEMEKIGGNSEKMGGRVKASGLVAKVGIAAITTAALAAARSAVIMAADFEKGMTSVSTLVDTSAESMSAMNTAVLDIAKRTPVALSDLTEGLYNVRSAGISAEDAMMVLEKSAQLGVSGLGSTTEAVNLATSAINAFGLDGEEAGRVFDILQNTVKAGKTDISKLAQSFGNVAGLAKTSGVSLEELMGATAALTTSGQEASVAQNGLRAAMMSISKPTKEMAGIVAGLGYESGQAMVAQLGIVESMRAVEKATNGSSEAMGRAFGSSEALTTAISLAGEQAGAYDEIMVSMANSVGTAEEAFEKQKATFDSQYKMLKNNLSVVMIQIGNVILPLLSDAISAILPIIESVSSWFAQFANEGEEAGESLTGLADIAKNYLLPVITGVFDLIGSAIETWSEIWKNESNGVQEYTMMTFGYIADVIKVALTSIETVFGVTAALMRGDWEGAMNFLEGQTEKMIGINTEAFTAFGLFFRDWFDGLASYYGGKLFDMIASIKQFGTDFGKAWNDTWTGAARFFEGIWQGILGSLSKHLNNAIGLINKVISAMNSIKGVNIAALSTVSLGSNNSSPMPNIEGRAKGGSVTGGTPYVVGEEGPELFVPRGSGSIVPNNQMGGMNITINNPVVDSEERMRQLSNMIEQKLTRQMQLQRFGATI